MLASVIKAEFEKHPYLIIPEELRKILDYEKDFDITYINGCGSASGMSAGLGPTTVNGVSIIVACYIHDFRYTVGETYADKVAADMEFLMNMNLIIANDPTTNQISVAERQLRFNEALMMFKFVDVYGAKAFVEGKFAKLPTPSYVESFTKGLYITFRTVMIPFDIFKNAAVLKVRSLSAG